MRTFLIGLGTLFGVAFCFATVKLSGCAFPVATILIHAFAFGALATKI